jgi:hypothetical protein
VKKSHRVFWACVVGLVVFVCLKGCPGTDAAALLPGHWVSADEQFQDDLVIRTDGTYSLKTSPRSSFLNFIGAALETEGRWQLTGNRLQFTVTRESSPSGMAAPDSAIGKTGVAQIQELTRIHLILSGQRFVRR